MPKYLDSHQSPALNTTSPKPKSGYLQSHSLRANVLLALLSSAGHLLPRSHSSSHHARTLIPIPRRVSDEWVPSFQLTFVPIHGAKAPRGLGILGMATPLKLFCRMYITPSSPRSLCCSLCFLCPSFPSSLVQAHLPAVIHSLILYLLQFIHLCSYLNLLARCPSF